MISFFALRHKSLQMLVLLLLTVARGDTVKGKAWKHFSLLNELRAEGSLFRWLGGSCVPCFRSQFLCTSAIDIHGLNWCNYSTITLLKWNNLSEIERVQDNAGAWTLVLNIVSLILFDKAFAVWKLLQFLSIPQHKNCPPVFTNFGYGLVMLKWPCDYGLN